MSMISHTRERIGGFSLIEVIIYLAVLVLATIAVVTTFFSLRSVFERNRTERELADAATEILERIGREARYATSVKVTSTLDTSPGVLDLDQGATTTKFYVSNNNVTVSQNGVVQGPLDPDSVSVNSLIFNKYDITGTSTAVRTALTLSVSGRYASTSKTFYTTSILRGSYDP